jgi:hypothetical protein
LADWIERLLAANQSETLFGCSVQHEKVADLLEGWTLAPSLKKGGYLQLAGVWPSNHSRQTSISARPQVSPALGDKEGCAARLRAAPFCARAACHEGEIASCEPVRLQARFAKAALSSRPARPPLCR